MVGEPPLPPPISAQLKHLLVHSPLPFRVEQIWSGCRNSRFSDRFTLLVPFCLEYVKWDVIYNAFYPFSAPDIIFPLDDEGFRPLIPISGGKVGIESQSSLVRSSLCDWNSKDSSRLFKLVHEIRDLYVEYHRRRVGEVDDARLKFEMSTILSREGIEVCVISGGLDKSEEVKFVVPLLDLDLNKLVVACPWKQEQKIFLQIVFPVSRRYSSTPSAPRIKLVSSSQLKDLFSVEDVKLPTWVNGMCMAEYLPSLEDTLKLQLLDAVTYVGARRRFIEALVPKFGRPLEADPIFCRKATFLAVTGVFTFLVYFSLSTLFPKQQPTLILQSSQHCNSHGAPIMSPILNNYPWSPRWDAAEMAERIFDFIGKECISFKTYCLEAAAH